MQLEFFDVPSPCVGICQSDDKGYCLGCMRTREERQTWLQYSSDDKQKVIKRCQQRFRRKKGLIKTKVEPVETEHQQGSLFEPKFDPKFDPKQAPEHPKNTSNSASKSQDNNPINTTKSDTAHAQGHSNHQATTDTASAKTPSQSSLDNNQALDFSDFEL